MRQSPLPARRMTIGPTVHWITEAVIILEITGLVAVDSGRPVAPAYENTLGHPVSPPPSAPPSALRFGPRREKLH